MILPIDIDIDINIDRLYFIGPDQVTISRGLTDRVYNSIPAHGAHAQHPHTTSGA